MTEYLVAFCLMIVGFLYSSVGHGGASGYIAVLTLFSIPMIQYKPVVLLLNIIIASLALVQYWRAGHFSWKLCWPFVLTSIPAAYLGSSVAVHSRIYNVLLGIALIVPVLKFAGWLPGSKEKEQIKPLHLMGALLIGAFIGFLSGLLNIGGGIFLSPVVLLLGWARMKQAAALSAAFIVVNSISGLLAIKGLTIELSSAEITWMAGAIIGGTAGSYLGSHKFGNHAVSSILALVLAIASVKLIFFS
jgi:uncharacterized protein